MEPDIDTEQPQAFGTPPHKTAMLQGLHDLQSDGDHCLQVLEKHIRNLLNLAVLLLLPDGLQMTMAGVFQVRPDVANKLSCQAYMRSDGALHSSYCRAKLVLLMKLITGPDESELLS